MNRLLFLVAVAVLLGAAPHAVRVASPARPVPYRSPADLPRNAWYRGLPPYTLRSLTEWQQVTAVDPPWISLHGRWYKPEELLSRFVWTADPLVEEDDLVVHACGRDSR